MSRSSRSLPALLALTVMAGGLLALPGGSAAAVSAAPTALANVATPGEDASEAGARAALDRATQIFSPQASARRATSVATPDATLALRDLFVARPRLSTGDQETAGRILARPSDGRSDPQGTGYSTGSQKICSAKICVHYVTSTADAPPSLAWVKKNLSEIQKVYNFEVGKLGYRAPAKEPNQPGTGGNAKFDVYLKDIGLGIYGYCAPEYLKPGTKSVASGYCVLDNDFARSQFGGANPATSLKVTAAHEFFHAIAFAYDFREDPWLLESTATWMEERYADSANDNRQYLAKSQVRNPKTPLDFFENNGTYHYGQWAFWEFLSQRYGNKVVKEVIGRASEKASGANLTSMSALSAALKKRGGLADNFAAYASANTIPQRNYSEGDTWPSSRLAAARQLSTSKRSFRATYKVDHLASNSVALTPARSLGGNQWKLKVSVNGPNRSSSPAAFVTVVTKRGLIRKSVSLNKSGAGQLQVPFARTSVQRVFVTVANASTRTNCGRGTTFTCEGAPRDDNRRFTVKVTAVK